MTKPHIEPGSNPHDDLQMTLDDHVLNNPSDDHSNDTGNECHEGPSK